MLREIDTLLNDLTGGKAAAAFFGIFQGRCTFAAICFSIIGVYGWLHGKDLGPYSAFVTVVQGLLLVHSYKEDIASNKDGQS